MPHAFLATQQHAEAPRILLFPPGFPLSGDFRVPLIARHPDGPGFRFSSGLAGPTRDAQLAVMRKPPAGIMVLVTLVAAAAIVGIVIRKADKAADTVKIGFQDAAVPLAMPTDGEIDHRFHILSAWQVAEVPRATRFDMPMGSLHGALVYNAQKFWEMNEKRGGHHTGDDLNGIGGMNTDLGDPVFASADGLVIYTGEPSPGWGNIVVLAHRAPDGRMIHSMYAHLHTIGVAPGDLVSRGAKVGSVGTANGYYPAHLHYEIRESDGVDIGAGYSMFPLNRLDPLATVALFQGGPPDFLPPAALALAVKADPDAWTDLEIQGAEKMPGLKER